MSGVFFLMKDVLIRSVFGALFLMVVFTPFVYDVRHDANLMNLVFYTFTMLGTHELFEMSKKSPFQNNLKLPALLMITTLFLPLLLQTLSHFYPTINNSFWHLIIESPLLLILWGILIITILVFCYWIFKKEKIDFVFKNTFIFNFFYPVLPMWILAMAYTLTNNFDKQMLLIVLLPIYLNDTLAYVSGRIFGKNPLLPSVSPKKTWEGFIGGLIGAAAVMLAILYFIGSFNTINAIAIAGVSVLASILATFGDLFESKLKRSIDIKDSGNILPGHGGILDRIDAMLFVAPVLYVLLALIS
ncbi:Phosphatidate cytidylyltransferase [compost metagenome]